MNKKQTKTHSSPISLPLDEAREADTRSEQPGDVNNFNSRSNGFKGKLNRFHTRWQMKANTNNFLFHL